MARFLKKISLSKGEQPGSLIFIGQKKQEEIRIRVMKYNADDLVEKECNSLEEAFAFIDKDGIAWINIDGIHDPGIIAGIGDRFNISGLLLEDFMNSDQRPKFEEHEDQLVIIAKLLNYNGEQQMIESDQISMIFGPGYVLTLQEKVGNHFDPVRNRIRKASNRSRIIYPDYLAYALLDCMMDNYMEIIGEIGEQIENLDEEVLHTPGRETIAKLYRYRTEMNFMRRNIQPLREISHAFLRSESPLLRDLTRDYILDLNDHIISSNEAIETYQLMIMDQMNLYNAGISNKANEIMKTLTIFASLFIPLTFVAGIYGMNFEIIPELKWHWGYLFFWSVIFVLGGGLILYFRRKKWF